MTSPIKLAIDSARNGSGAVRTARLRAHAAQHLKGALANQWELSGLNTFISKSRPKLPNILRFLRIPEPTNPDDQLIVDENAISRDAQLLAVKDNIVTIDSLTTCGSGILRQHKSPFEASVVSKLREKQCLVLGKTNLDEFGMGSHSTNSFFGIVHRDLTKQYSAGGSSGGSAVAVATKQCYIALGTDTGGSVRLPAAYNGVVGFKPSYGMVSRWGVIPYANSLDTVGVFTPTAAVAEHFWHGTSMTDHKDPTSLSLSCRQRMTGLKHELDSTTFSLKGLKIGIPIEYNIEELDPQVRQKWQEALERLQEEGCTLVPISLPNTKHALSAYYVLAASEAASNLSKYDGVRYGTRSGSVDGAGDVLFSETRGDGFGDEVKRRILLGSYTLSSEAVDNYFIQAQKVRRLVQNDFDRVFRLPNPLRPTQQFDLSDMDPSIELNDKLGPSQVDFIVCPTAPTPASTLKSISEQTPVDTYMNDVFTVPSSLAGLPTISLPSPIYRKGLLPDKSAFAGIQIIGQYGDDWRLIHAAKAFENPVKQRRSGTNIKRGVVDVVWTNGVEMFERVENPYRLVLVEEIPGSLYVPENLGNGRKTFYRTFIEYDKVVITSFTHTALFGRANLKRETQEIPLLTYERLVAQAEEGTATERAKQGSDKPIFRIRPKKRSPKSILLTHFTSKKASKGGLVSEKEVTAEIEGVLALWRTLRGLPLSASNVEKDTAAKKGRAAKKDKRAKKGMVAERAAPNTIWYPSKQKVESGSAAGKDQPMNPA